MRTAAKLQPLGYTVVPHIAARSLADRTQLAGIIRECAGYGISEVFAVGGDAPQPRVFRRWRRAAARDRRTQRRPDGRWGRRVSGGSSRHRPAAAARIIVGQAGTCLQRRHSSTGASGAESIHSYTAMLRREGVNVPVLAGVAGAVPRTRLIALATKIGVGTSLRFLSRKRPLARRLLSGERYSPGTLSINELTAQPVVDGIHLYSFNCFDELPGTFAASSTEPSATGLEMLTGNASPG